MQIYVQLIPIISGVMVCLMAAYVLHIKRTLLAANKQSEQLVDSLSKEIQGISHGSVGVGRKVLLLEKHIEKLESLIDEIQKNDPAKVSYSEAARLVELGAGVDDLMNSCGISRPEAELVSALTHSKKEQIPTLTSRS
jgi:hypothetical protein